MSAPFAQRPATTSTLPFTAPWLLAPMEGVTDPCFREVVLERNGPDVLGGAYTEFVRVLDRPRKPVEIRFHLRGRRFEQPIGVQLMGRDLDALAGSADAAVEAGAPLVDLNFGCPAKGALRGCAGSAVLREPARLESIVRVVTHAVAGRVPVTAKIRAGYDDASQVEEIARAAEAGGASLLTIHCRTKRESYQPEVDWTRIRRAVEAVDIPVCGNGGVDTHADLERMRAETGCAYVMVGQAALYDPWVFSGRSVDRREAARFLADYARTMLADGAQLRGAVARVKQLLRDWRAGAFVRDEDDRRSWLTERDPEAFHARLVAIGTEPGSSPNGAVGPTAASPRRPPSAAGAGGAVGG